MLAVEDLHTSPAKSVVECAGVGAVRDDLLVLEDQQATGQHPPMFARAVRQINHMDVKCHVLAPIIRKPSCGTHGIGEHGVAEDGERHIGITCGTVLGRQDR